MEVLTEITVRWMDCTRHGFLSALAQWVDVAGENFVRRARKEALEAGAVKSVDQTGWVVRVHDFVTTSSAQQIENRDVVQLLTSASKLGRSSFVLQHHLLAAVSGEILGHACSTLVATDSSGTKKIHFDLGPFLGNRLKPEFPCLRQTSEWDRLVNELLKGSASALASQFAAADHAASRGRSGNSSSKMDPVGPFVYDFETRPSDLDALQHVNNARYVEYAHDCRVNSGLAGAFRQHPGVDEVALRGETTAIHVSFDRPITEQKCTVRALVWYLPRVSEPLRMCRFAAALFEKEQYQQQAHTIVFSRIGMEVVPARAVPRL